MSVSGPTNDHETIRRWANENHCVPAEELPSRLDSKPAMLRLVSAHTAETRKDVIVVSWEDFFAKFDLHGLTFICDGSGYNEILQIDAKSPYRREEDLG